MLLAGVLLFGEGTTLVERNYFTGLEGHILSTYLVSGGVAITFIVSVVLQKVGQASHVSLAD